MSSLWFGVFFILLVAAGVFYVSAELAIHGNMVAEDLCVTGGAFCQHPEYLALAAGGAGFLWLTMSVSGR
jgi:hypothetical protein